MTVTDVFDFFRREGVEVGVVEKNLWLDTDPILFPSEIRKAIASHKGELVRLIEEEKDYQERLQALTAKGLQVADASWAQQRIWFLSQLSPDIPAYNICMAYRTRGELDIFALEKAIDCLVERHTVLRSVYEVRESELVQVVMPHVPFYLGQEDLSGMTPSAAEGILGEILKHNAMARFDLTRDLMMRCQVVRLSELEHVIVFSVHHIAFDGWSASVFLDELKHCYTSLKSNGTAEFETAAFQYADFAEWQAHDYGGIRAHEEMAYWERQLQDLPALHALPLDYPRPPVQSYSGASMRRTLNPALVSALRRFAQQNNCTLFTLLESLLALLIYRLSGLADVSIGVPVANRMVKQIESTIGCFVNTIVLRSVIQPGQAFEEFLSSSNLMINEAFSYQEVPFELVVGLINPERSTAYSPLFQIMFDLQVAGSGLDLEGLQASPEPLGIAVSKFDLAVSAVDKGETIELVWDYSTDLFSAKRLEMMCDSYEVLVKSIIKDSRQKMVELPLVNDSQLDVLLRQRNQTTQVNAEVSTVISWFERQVAITPEHVAISSPERNYTYSELNDAANQLACHLRALGVGCDDLVGLCIERSAQWSVAVMAILKAGGAYLPLDPELPKERLAFMLDDAAPRAVLSVSAHAQLLQERTDEIVWLDAQASMIAELPKDNLDHEPALSDLAYVLYTSGSTGEPKGVLVEHGSLINFLDWIQTKILLEQDERLLVKAPIGFDVSVMELIWPLLFGARAVIAPAGAQRDPDQMLRIIIAEDVSVMQMTPSMLEVLITHPAWQNVTSLRHTISGGERLSASLVAAFHAQSRGCQLTNFYGPTEATIGVSCWPCEMENKHRTIPIGGPMQNTMFYVLNEAGVPQPDGVTGELYIGGLGVARGYLNRPELTRRSFVANPFLQGGGSLYRTGDLVRWTDDGVLEFIGRADQQVKLRGQRLELSEVEKHLLDFHGVERVAVVIQEGSAGDKRLVAYVVGSQTDASALKTRMRERLPEYMVPNAVVFVTELPLSINGKIDVAALPAVDLDATRSSSYVPPEGEIEARLCEILAVLLEVARVGRHDNFFEMGGHSILLTQFIQKVRDIYGVSLPLSAVFANMTPAYCAAMVERLIAMGQGAAGPLTPDAGSLVDKACSIDGVEFLDRGPASIRQEIMYRQMAGVSPRYRSVYWAQRYPAELDVPRFLNALQTVVNDHLLLRSNLALIAGRVRVVERVSQGQAITFDHQVFNGMSTDQIADRIELSLADFDLLRDRLLRVVLFPSSEDVIVFFSVPHLIFDGYSQEVLIAELEQNYLQHDRSLRSVKDDFMGFSISQRNMFKGERYHTIRHFWKTLLGDVWMNRHSNISASSAQGEVKGGGQVSRELEASRVLEVAKRLQTTPQIIYSFAFGLAVQAFHAGQKISFRIHTDGRDRPQVESTIGFLSNTVYLVMERNADLSLKMRFEKYFSNYVNCLKNQEYPGDVAVYLMPEEPRVNFVFKYSQRAAKVPSTTLLGQRLSGNSVYFSRIKRFYNPSLDISLVVNMANTSAQAVVYYPSDNIDSSVCVDILGVFESKVNEFVSEVLASDV